MTARVIWKKLFSFITITMFIHFVFFYTSMNNCIWLFKMQIYVPKYIKYTNVMVVSLESREMPRGRSPVPVEKGQGLTTGYSWRTVFSAFVNK